MSRPPLRKKRMKKLKVGMVTSAIALALAVGAWAAGTAYTTKQSNGSTTATVYFGATAGKQIRVVNLNGQSDKGAAVFSFRTGTAAYKVASAAVSTATNIVLTATNGLAANDVILIQTASGSFTNATIHGFESTGTNVALTAQIGFAVAAGDAVYELGSATTIRCGTNNPAAPTTYAGEAIYVGTIGRPVMIQVDGTSACTNTATVAYE
jgi:hypothetical protein